jgi:hypothetical protein
MLNVIMLSVDMQNVAAPCYYDDYFSVTNKCFMADFHENETKEREKKWRNDLQKFIQLIEFREKKIG